MEKQTHNYEDLLVWQKSMDLVEKIYFITLDFPKEELYGLTSQIRRAVFSIPLNISEGQGRKSKKEFSRFLFIARSSSYELSTALLIAYNLNYLDKKYYYELRDKIKEVLKMLNGLINFLK